jgi:hypothetical protein
MQEVPMPASILTHAPHKGSDVGSLAGMDALVSQWAGGGEIEEEEGFGIS